MLEDPNNQQGSTEGGELMSGLEQLFDVSAEHFPYPVLLTGTDIGETLSLVAHPQRQMFQVMYRDQIAGLINLSHFPGILELARAGAVFEAVISENYAGRCRVLIRQVKDS